MENHVLQKYYRIIIFFSACLFLFLKPVSEAGSSQLKEYHIKAAFLYNFANFVEWPPNAFSDDVAPIVLGVVGNNQLVEILNAASLKPIRGRIILAKGFESMENLESCHILFVDQSEKDNLQQILNKIKSKSILTVSDMPGFAQRGGIIDFIEIDNQIRFEINLQAARQTNLIISSKLLNLAMIISGPSIEENK